MVGERIRQARQINELTLAELAGAAGVTASVVSQYERNLKDPTPAVLTAIAVKTGFPIGYFGRPPADAFGQGTLMFRCRASVSAKGKMKLQGWAENAYEVAQHLRSRVVTTPNPLPTIDPSDATDGSRVGQLLRATLGLHPWAPLSNLTAAAERAGVVIVMVPTTVAGVDAFSTFAGPDREVPVVFLFPASDDGARLRMTLAHELVHLACRHRPSAEAEREAAEGASALLLPPEIIGDELVPPVRLSDLEHLRVRWKMSAKAIVYAGQHNGILSKDQARRLYQQMNARGWAQAEPGPIPAERPRALRKLAEMFYGEPPDARQLAVDLNLPEMHVAALLAAHAEKPRQQATSGDVIQIGRPARGTGRPSPS